MACRRCAICNVDWPRFIVKVPRTTNRHAVVAIDDRLRGSEMTTAFFDCPVCGATTREREDDAITGEAAVNLVKGERFDAYYRWWDETRPSRTPSAFDEELEATLAWWDLVGEIARAAGVERPG